MRLSRRLFRLMEMAAGAPSVNPTNINFGLVGRTLRIQADRWLLHLDLDDSKPETVRSGVGAQIPQPASQPSDSELNHPGTVAMETGYLRPIRAQFQSALSPLVTVWSNRRLSNRRPGAPPTTGTIYLSMAILTVSKRLVPTFNHSALRPCFSPRLRLRLQLRLRPCLSFWLRLGFLRLRSRARRWFQLWHGLFPRVSSGQGPGTQESTAIFQAQRPATGSVRFTWNIAGRLRIIACLMRWMSTRKTSTLA